MSMTLAYAIALSEARSCLAALADSARTVEDSIRYDRLLLDLDFLHTVSPALETVHGTPQELFGRLEDAVDRLIALGASEGLRLEILLAEADLRFPGAEQLP
jgi:hypothetical protein